MRKMLVYYVTYNNKNYKIKQLFLNYKKLHLHNI